MRRWGARRRRGAAGSRQPRGLARAAYGTARLAEIMYAIGQRPVRVGTAWSRAAASMRRRLGAETRPGERRRVIRVAREPPTKGEGTPEQPSRNGFCRRSAAGILANCAVGSRRSGGARSSGPVRYEALFRAMARLRAMRESTSKRRTWMRMAAAHAAPVSASSATGALRHP